MKSIVESLRRHVLDYATFYAASHGLVGPCILLPFLFTDIDVAFSLMSFGLGGVLISGASTSKRVLPERKASARASLVIGLVIDTVFVFRLLKPACSSPAVALPLIIMVGITIWFTVIYFLDLSDWDREKDKRILRKIFAPLALCGFIIYGPLILLLNYQAHRMHAALPAGLKTTSRDWMLVMLGYLLVTVALILFFYFYRRALRAVSDEGRV